MKNSSPTTTSTNPILDAKAAVTNDLENDFSYGTSVATCAPNIRLGFLRKVYSILAVQLAITTFISAICMVITPIRNIILAANGIISLISIIATFGTLFALLAYKDSHPLNIQLLIGFTVAESLMVGSICAQYAASGLSVLVIEALAITMAIFGGITLYAFISKKDFSFMGGALFAGLLALIGCSFINLILGVTGNESPALAFLMSFGGSVLFSLYILYDSK